VTDDDRWPRASWHDSQPLVLAAGVAALLLVALLVYAVVRVSHDSLEPPGVMRPGTSVATTPGTELKTPSSTSYSVPRVTTSQESAPPPPPPAESPDEDEPSESTEQETTTYNPYTTTTTSNAGAI
jgi:hypothetical protein